MEFRREMDLDNELAIGNVVLKFHAEWCIPCKMMTPILDKVSDENNIKIVSIDAEKFPEISKRYEISSVPAIFFYKNGEQIANTTGAMTGPAIVKMFE